MTNKLHLIQNPVFLTCHWAPTGDPKMPLACVWTASKHFQSASTASSTDETGRMPPVRLAEPQFEAVATPAEGVRVAGVTVRRSWQKYVLTFLMVFGPGLIVMEADNDAGAVSTYMQAGGQYGLHLLWTLIVLLPICYFVQEMMARLGIATGKGHAAIIYERFVKWWGRFSLFDLLLVNFLTLITEFAAISLALSALGVSPWISVPVSALGLTLMVVTCSYLRWKRIVIALTMPAGSMTSSLVFLVIAIVGTTIAPWQLFSNRVAWRRSGCASPICGARLDTRIGVVFAVAVACSREIPAEARASEPPLVSQYAASPTPAML
jgi:hypothetical protein